MEPRELLNALHIAERLKDETRHCFTSGGRKESVAEHSWRAALMVFFMKDQLTGEFPEADFDRIIKMCLIHDLGECFTGDVPVFAKTAADEEKEDEMLDEWVNTLPEGMAGELAALYTEMAERKTIEARIFKAVDGLEAVIQHNESDIETWEDHEYDLNLTYCQDRVCFSDYLTRLRAEIRSDTELKIAEANK